MRSLLLDSTKLYLMLAVLVGLPLGRGSMVLCIESDGHVAVERGVVACSDRPVAASEPACAAAEDDCSDCVDLPMGSTILSAGRTAVPAPALAGVAHGMTAELQATARHACLMPAPIASSGDRSGPTLSPPRTSILRN